VNPLASALERVGSHDHLCSIYHADAERLAVAAAFLRIGLGRGEKCIYLCDDPSDNGIARALAAEGCEAERFIQSGALTVLPKEQAYLRGGRFDPERMFDFWQRAAAAAKDQGYSAVRGVGETDWVLGAAPGLDRWLDYEAHLTDVLGRCDCMLLCQYNRSHHSAELLLGIIQTHPLVIYDGAVCTNQYYAPAAELLPPGESARAVQRWLHNIREFGQGQLALRRGQELVERRRNDLLHEHQRFAQQYGAIGKLNEQLRQADARNALILDAITDMYFAFDKDFRFAFMNRHAAKRLSLIDKDPAQTIGRLIWDEFPDSPNAETLGRVMRERIALTDEEYYAPTQEWFENRIYPSSDGGVVVLSRNVTARKRGEEAQRRSEAYLEAAQHISHTGSWAFDLATRDLFWSAEHYRIMGLDAGVKPSYERFFERVHPDDRAAVAEAFEAAVRGRRNFATSYRIVRPDGSVRHLRSEAHLVLDASDEPLEYIGAIVDITERKESDEAVHKAREELAHVSRALTVAELTASIAHELNQPLAAIVANAAAGERWLGLEPPNALEVYAALRRITRDANRAAQVIARIRALLTRADAQKADLALGELIADVLSLVEGEARHKEIVLSATVEKHLPPIRADRVRIQQVLLNLLVNAMEVLLLVSAPRTLEVSATRDDGTVTVRVKDSGPGIDPQSIERVFEPFFSTKRGGMGMGLAISRSIIEEQGGRIGAVNNVDAPGATFEFTLPLHPQVQ
jgi:PAS domain S-box-containing protein